MARRGTGLKRKGGDQVKEVKAFIRCRKAEEVIARLEAAGIHDMTLIDVMGLGQHLTDSTRAKYSVKCVEKYSEVAKIEIVCRDEEVDTIVGTIQKTAYTGMKGDGMIYVSPVEQTVKIRTGHIGAEAL
jgi:nitrogen regulatory protein P-II 1